MRYTVIMTAAALTLTTACTDDVFGVATETRLDRTGTLNCDGTELSSQDLVQGTAIDPARCGPQSQPVAE